jgi:serine/threonine-protein kinase HipA
MGRKTWTPGKTLSKFIAATFGVSLKIQIEIVEAIGDAIADTAPKVRAAMKSYPDFKEIGARMLLTWNAGVNGLRDRSAYSLAPWEPAAAFKGISDLPRQTKPDRSVGRSEGLAKRTKRLSRTQKR